MAVGPGSVDDPVDIGNGNEIAMVREFPYLGSMMSASGSVDTELGFSPSCEGLPGAWCLREPVFLCRHLSVATEKERICSCSVLYPLIWSGDFDGKDSTSTLNEYFPF